MCAYISCVYIHVHTYIHTYIHTCKQPLLLLTHTYIHTYVQTNISSAADTYTHIHTHILFTCWLVKSCMQHPACLSKTHQKSPEMVKLMRTCATSTLHKLCGSNFWTLPWHSVDKRCTSLTSRCLSSCVCACVFKRAALSKAVVKFTADMWVI